VGNFLNEVKKWTLESKSRFLLEIEHWYEWNIW
jgi:hypothetical protein